MLDIFGMKYEIHTSAFYSHPILQTLHELVDLTTAQQDFSQQLPILDGR